MIFSVSRAKCDGANRVVTIKRSYRPPDNRDVYDETNKVDCLFIFRVCSGHTNAQWLSALHTSSQL